VPSRNTQEIFKLNNVLDLISKIGEQESSLTGKTFVSPVYYNTEVATRIARMVYTFQIPGGQHGWLRIKPINSKRAKVVGPAELGEIEEYQKYLPKIRVALMMKQKDVYMGIPDKSNKFGLGISNPIPIFLTDDYPADFDRIIVRFDGANFWYDRVDTSNDPTKGNYLRECMTKLVSPEKLKFTGLTLEEKHAYALRVSFDKRFVEDQKKSTIQQDVEFAGGKFKSFEEKSDHFSVTYIVEGQQFTSRISKDPRRMVLSAGLCLAGDDHKFDLKSLVTVIREAQHKRIVHIGDFAPNRDYDEDDD
jgi:hypothetical protein